MQIYIKCAKHIACDFKLSIQPFSKSLIHRFFLVFFPSSFFCPNHLHHRSRYFFFFFLKLKVQLHPSGHDRKNSLLSLWFCHGFWKWKPCGFDVGLALLTVALRWCRGHPGCSDVRVLVYFGGTEWETGIGRWGDVGVRGKEGLELALRV